MYIELIVTLWRLSAHTETNGERSKVIDGQNRDTHPNCTDDLPVSARFALRLLVLRLR